MVHFRDLLKSEGITDLSVLDADVIAFIKEYEAIEKSKLPTIKNKETGEYTPNAQSKLNRLNKTIVKEIAEYVAEQNFKFEEQERQRLLAEQEEQEKLKKQKDAEEAEQERIRLENEINKKKRSKLFSAFLGD
jgi:hypothetical protein